MTTETYKSFVEDGFKVNNLRKRILSNLNSIPPDLLKMTGDELYFVVDRGFSNHDDASNNSNGKLEQKKKLMPILTPVNEVQVKHLEVNRIVIKSPTEASDELLLKTLMSSDISIIKNMALHTNFNMGLFETKELAEEHPKMLVDIRIQDFHPDGLNLNSSGESVWLCTSELDHMPLASYAAYQEEQLKKFLNGDSNIFKQTEQVKFGTNFDLSDKTNWPRQLKEFRKLPNWAHYDGAGNMIGKRYPGAPILGMNTVQLYLKVPGSRTPGHQENNNFCSINLNVGPGDTEWFAVPYSCWMVIEGLCRKNDLNFLSDPWWPNLEDLKKVGCPFYRFIQKPGEIVFVNVGCVHWVQAVGVCNNIAWNIGPMVNLQYKAAMERYELNKLEKFRSLVPMQYVSWNLAVHPNLQEINDPGLVCRIHKTLAKSLAHFAMISRIVRECYKHVKFTDRIRHCGEVINYCQSCQRELFGHCFVLNTPDLEAYETFCFECAKKKSSDLSEFGCITEFVEDDLINIYNYFLAKVHPTFWQKQKLAEKKNKRKYDIFRGIDVGKSFF